MKMNELLNIINMTNEIVDNLGYPIYEEDYYTNSYVGDRYSYENLEITKYEGGSLYVYLDDNKVLSYDYSSRDLYYIGGKWTKLIEIIHEDIPNVLAKRRFEEQCRNYKKEELKDLEEYFKYYIICSKNKPEVKEIIDSLLADKQIEIEKRTGYTTLRNLCTGDDMYNPYYYFVVKEKDKEVAEFHANQFEVFPSLEDAAENFRLGDWTDDLKQVITAAKKEEKLITQRKLDTSADVLIKKYKR